MKKATALLVAVVMMFGLFTGCGKSKETVKKPNAKTATYEEMVNYLIAEGYINKDAKPIDINKTKGYLKDNTGGQFTETQVADKAYDYSGLWLFWWDLDKKTANYENYKGLAVNSGTIVLGGGAATLNTEGKNGAFAIAFSKNYANKDKVIADFSALLNK